VAHSRQSGRIVTTAGIARRGDALFLARRSSEGTQHGKWEFPGGKCEAGETLAQCVEREFLEEFETPVTVGREIGRVPFAHGGDLFVLVGVEITFAHDPQKMHEHSETGWFTPAAAARLDLIDSDRELLATIPGRLP